MDESSRKTVMDRFKTRLDNGHSFDNGDKQQAGQMNRFFERKLRAMDNEYNRAFNALNIEKFKNYKAVCTSVLSS